MNLLHCIFFKFLMVPEDWNPAERARSWIQLLWPKNTKLAIIKSLSLTYNDIIRPWSPNWSRALPNFGMFQESCRIWFPHATDWSTHHFVNILPANHYNRLYICSNYWFGKHNTFIPKIPHRTKGQLISKGLVGILNSSKKRTKKFD